ncbi:MAG: pirin family protein [Bacteroidetes bacterium]|nr:pirin family protein [Bacteroidota bacterium]MCL5267275.1 pirin family protein [Bacteroidota bacterium]
MSKIPSTGTEYRKIKRVFKSRATLEGAGVHLKRAFGFHEAKMFDPFLLLDDFRSNNPEQYLKGFPWHPHRGIETITYVLKGDVEHGDSMENKGVINAGDVQWMTAGSGIIHQEMPKGDNNGRMYGFQLWANLPKTHKMMDPRYQEVKSGQLPVVTRENGTKIKVVAGEVEGVKGPVTDIVITPQYLDVTIPANASFDLPTTKGRKIIAYVIDGKGYFTREKDLFSYEIEGSDGSKSDSSQIIGNENLVLFDDGEAVEVTTSAEPVRFLLFSGRPIGEPIAWYGPIVMNHEGELRTAFEELENGTFVKKHVL